MFKQTQNPKSGNGKTKAANGRKPNLIAYDVRATQDPDKAVWNRVGAVWFHKDGKGADLLLHALPLTGRIVLRERTEKPDQ